ncbi:MAG: short-chain fatty acyl-CoA regulator family protein [Sphingobium sp.]
MAKERTIYMGPRLKRLRRELGLTQAAMADDLEISPSYIALLERNQRPLTADLLLRLARTYRMDMTDLAGDGGAEASARLQAMLKDPMFADIDLPTLEVADIATSYPGIAEVLFRVYTAYQEEHLALADHAVLAAAGGDPATDSTDPVVEAQLFLSARGNCFPALDEAAERLAEQVAADGGIVPYLKAKHRLRVRLLPTDVMGGSWRRYDRHREAILLDDMLDVASQTFQLALQLAYIELGSEMAAALKGAHFATETGERLTRRALASYAASAILMPYTAFAKAVDATAYDVEALARQFRTSYEQTAHRLTTLRKPGNERVPFFFIRLDQAGNISKRLDGAGFPFARHGGACPLWSVHTVFLTPGEIVTQWLELPDGKRFFSIARTVLAGGGGYGRPRVQRAVALACGAEHAGQLVYTQAGSPLDPNMATPIGISCRLCQRTDCMARAVPPVGRKILRDDYQRTAAPFGFSDD